MKQQSLQRQKLDKMSVKPYPWQTFVSGHALSFCFSKKMQCTSLFALFLWSFGDFWPAWGWTMQPGKEWARWGSLPLSGWCSAECFLETHKLSMIGWSWQVLSFLTDLETILALTLRPCVSIQNESIAPLVPEPGKRIWLCMDWIGLDALQACQRNLGVLDLSVLDHFLF